MNFKNYFRELKRRNVFKAALAYLVVAWVVVQVSAIVLPAFKAPPVVLRTLIVLLIIGFPVWLIFAWIYEVTPEGLKRTESISPETSITEQTSTKMNKLILAALGVAILLLGADIFLSMGKPEREMNPDEVIAAGEAEKESREGDQKSIAVLAFEDMSPKQDQEYFADGISEEILNSLAKSPELAVISRTSSFYFEDKNATIEQIAEKLGVNYVLEGSVRKAGDQLRITAQLIEVSSGSHLWSQTYDRELKDVFKIQDEIAQEVSSKLQATLLGGESWKTDPELYSLFLRARHLVHQNNPSSYRTATEILQKVTSMDPEYAPAWSLLGILHMAISSSGAFGTEVTMKEFHAEKAGAAARKAIALDPDHAMGYMAMAGYMLSQNNFKKAKEYGEKALELSPDNPYILKKIDLYTFPPLEESIRNIKRSIELDPMLYSAYRDLAWVYMAAGENKKALQAVETYQSYHQDSFSIHFLKARILGNLGRYEEALEVIQKEKDEFWKAYGLVEILYNTGQKEKALSLLDKFIRQNPLEAANIADIYASLGMKEKTFEWLQKAKEIDDPSLGAILYMHSFVKYQSDPRWQDLMNDLGMPEDNGITRENV